VAETTQAPAADPADLITDEDLYAVQDLISAGAGLDVALYEYAPGWRARWVAEALEELASRCDAATDHIRSVPADVLDARTLVWAAPSSLRALAAEYRAGTR
jgi:hypothetical protein